MKFLWLASFHLLHFSSATDDAEADENCALQLRGGLVGGHCEPAAHVPCPGSGNMCSGDQCCPRDALSGGLTFPCPSASDSFAGCENNTKVESCLKPSASLRQENGKDPQVKGLVTPGSITGVLTAKDPDRYGYLHLSPASVTGTATKAKTDKTPYEYGYGHLGPADLTFSKTKAGQDKYEHGTNYWGPLGGSSTRTINNKCEYRYIYTYVGPSGKPHKRDYRRVKNGGKHCPASLRQENGKDPQVKGLITPGSITGVVTAKDPDRYGYLHLSPASVTGTATKAKTDNTPYEYGYGHLGPADLTFSKTKAGQDKYEHGTNYWGPLGGSSTRTINNKCEYRYIYTYVGPNGKPHKRDYRRVKNGGKHCPA